MPSAGTAVEILRRHEDGGRLLFHGTAEPFEGSLRPSGYDHVLWTADNPQIAQAYIPVSGISSILADLPAFMFEERVTPSPNNFWYTVARNMGFEATDIEFDRAGDVRSWRLPEGYPRNRDARDWLLSKGYAPQNGVFTVSVVLGKKDQPDKIMDAKWKKPGRLFVAAPPELKLKDVTIGRDGDLQDLDYHKLDLFRVVEAEGFDAIVIHDFVQSRTWGNLQHKSIGLFGHVLPRIEWVELPAVNVDPEPGRPTTDEFEAWLASARQEHSPSSVTP